MYQTKRKKKNNAATQIKVKSRDDAGAWFWTHNHPLGGTYRTAAKTRCSKLKHVTRLDESCRVVAESERVSKLDFNASLININTC